MLQPFASCLCFVSQELLSTFVSLMHYNVQVLNTPDVGLLAARFCRVFSWVALPRHSGTRRGPETSVSRTSCKAWAELKWRRQRGYNLLYPCRPLEDATVQPKCH